MQRKKVITIENREITITELNVAQIEEVPDEKSEVSTLDLLFPEHLPASVISKSTGISVNKLQEDYYPSELKEIIDSVESLNPFFFNMMKRFAALGQEAIKNRTLSQPAAG